MSHECTQSQVRQLLTGICANLIMTGVSMLKSGLELFFSAPYTSYDYCTHVCLFLQLTGIIHEYIRAINDIRMCNSLLRFFARFTMAS